MSSFANIRQSMARTTTSLLQKAGAVEKTIDKAYEEEERKFKYLESKTETLFKDAKQYLDSLRAMSLAQQRISEAITTFYDDTAVLGLCGLKFKDAMTLLDTTVRQQTDSVLRETLLEPLGRFVSLYPDIHEAMKRRANKLLDYDALRTKVKKLADKPSDDASKLPRAEAQCSQAKEEYETLNQQMLDEIPKLIDARIGYLDPCFEALIKAQLRYYTESFNAVQPLAKYFDDNGDPETRINDAMQQMRDLAIVRVAADKSRA